MEQESFRAMAINKFFCLIMAGLAGILVTLLFFNAVNSKAVKPSEEALWTQSCTNRVENVDCVSLSNSLNLKPFDDESKNKNVNETTAIAPSSSDIRNKYGIYVKIGDARANYELAEALFQEGNISEALNHLHISAEIGLPDARYTLAGLYEQADGPVGQDFFEAYIWYASIDDFFMRSKATGTYKDSTSRAKMALENLTQAEIDKSLIRLENAHTLSLERSRDFGKKLIEYFESKKGK